MKKKKNRQSGIENIVIEPSVDEKIRRIGTQAAYTRAINAYDPLKGINPERRRIIRNTVLDKIEERELAGYDTLQSSDITDIIEILKDENISITRTELCEFGLNED